MIHFRPHTSADYPDICRLRWFLKLGDSAATDGADFQVFQQSYTAHLLDCDRIGDTMHWLADDGGSSIGLMTVRIVRKEPSPGRPAGSWGYLTNCILLAQRRNRGVGSDLLQAVIGWATGQGLELLIVWPSEQSYPFYRRVGFFGDADPLELVLSD